MNQQDKEAFEKWWNIYASSDAFQNNRDSKVDMKEAFQSALEYERNKGFTPTFSDVRTRLLFNSLEQERQKSAKLVEALEEIKRCCDEGEFLFVSSTIREALAEYKAKEGGE